MITLGKVVVFLIAVLAVRGKNSTNPKEFLGPSARPARENEFPHQVSIQIDGSHSCGGSLITYRHVLTAAHCVRIMVISDESQFVKGQRMIVEVGSNILGQGIKHSVKRISEISTYPGWGRTIDGSFTQNDIAVITLRTPVTPSPKVNTIKLPAAMTEIPFGSYVDVSGFGTIDGKGPASKFLRTSRMAIVSEEECKYHYNVRSSHICAKWRRGHGTCPGDSGGPLINGNTIFGVVSGGMNKCAQGHPDVYTKVSHFIPYIIYEMNYPNVSNHILAKAVDIPEPPANALPPRQNLGRYNIRWVDLDQEVYVTRSEPAVNYINELAGSYPQSESNKPLYPFFFEKLYH